MQSGEVPYVGKANESKHRAFRRGSQIFGGNVFTLLLVVMATMELMIGIL